MSENCVMFLGIFLGLLSIFSGYMSRKTKPLIASSILFGQGWVLLHFFGSIFRRNIFATSVTVEFLLSSFYIELAILFPIIIFFSSRKVLAVCGILLGFVIGVLLIIILGIVTGNWTI